MFCKCKKQKIINDEFFAKQSAKVIVRSVELKGKTYSVKKLNIKK